MRSLEPAPVSANPARCAPCHEPVKQTHGSPRDYFVRFVGISVHVDTLISARADVLFVCAGICKQLMAVHPLR